MMMCRPYPWDQGLFPVCLASRGTMATAPRIREAPLLLHQFTNSPILWLRSAHPGRDDLGERVPRAIEPRLHRAEIAVRDLGDLFVRLPLQLPQHEHLPMVRRQLRARL